MELFNQLYEAAAQSGVIPQNVQQFTDPIMQTTQQTDEAYPYYDESANYTPVAQTPAPVAKSAPQADPGEPTANTPQLSEAELKNILKSADKSSGTMAKFKVWLNQKNNKYIFWGGLAGVGVLSAILITTARKK